MTSGRRPLVLGRTAGEARTGQGLIRQGTILDIPGEAVARNPLSEAAALTQPLSPARHTYNCS